MNNSNTLSSISPSSQGGRFGFERHQLTNDLKGTSLSCKCVGGGRILHTPEEKKIFVYGYSVCYGRADHNITVSMLKKKFSEYTSITFSNDGY